MDVQVEPGIWEMDLRVNVMTSATLKVVGDTRDCRQLRLLSNPIASRIQGLGGSIEILNTTVNMKKATIRRPLQVWGFNVNCRRPPYLSR